MKSSCKLCEYSHFQNTEGKEHYLLVILVHGTNPLTHAFSGSGCSSNLLWYKVWVDNVLVADDGDEIRWYVVLVIFVEALQKPYVSQKLFGRAPKVFNFFPRAGGVRHTIWLDAFENADCLHHQLDSCGWAFHGLHYTDIL